jgi:8-oxo-dGTP diphosphatase
MARAPALAAGGIVLRQGATPLVAVVRLRKRNEWVLPKGKLDDGETPRDAAEREVLEETGHDVSVHEFLGTLVCESGGGFKVVHYWRMETSGEPAHELMDDVRAVDWLPLEAAVERLSRASERAFLANVGPLALQAAARARVQNRSKPRKPPVPVKRRPRPTVAPRPSPPMPAILPPSDAMPAPAEADLPLVLADDLVEAQPIEIEPVASPTVEAQPADDVTEFGIAPRSAEEVSATTAIEAESGNEAAPATDRERHVNLVQMVRNWLWRAA